MENKPKIIKYYTILFFFIGLSLSSAQTNKKDSIDQEPKYLDAIISDGDTIYIDYLDEVVLSDYKQLSGEDKREYYRLRKKVLKVYPFALEASNVFLEVNEKYQSIGKKRKRKKYTRKRQKWLQETFGDQLKQLKRSEGKILIKLIHRNLQVTAYDLIKFYRNGLTAFWWQGMAKLYSADLHKEYHPESNDEDRIIEMIIQKAIRDNIIEESKLSPYEVVKIQK